MNSEETVSQQVADCGIADNLSLNMDFTEDELFKPTDNSSLDSIDDNMGKMRYQSERQTSIEKIVNDVLIPPLSESNGPDNQSGNERRNIHSVSPCLDSTEIDLSNISPLSSSLKLHHTQVNNHPYFNNVDLNSNRPSSNDKSSANNAQDVNPADIGKIKPINISSSASTKRVHYSNTPNILSSEYANEYGQKSFHDSNVPVVKDDLYFLEYGNRAGRGLGSSLHHHAANNNNGNNGNSQRNKYLQQFNVNNLNLNLNNGASPHTHQLHSPHQLSGGNVAGHHPAHHHHQSSHHHVHSRSHHTTPNNNGQLSSHSSAQQTPNTTQTSPLTPHSVRTTLHSPNSVHSSHTPHTPHSMNHAFPRFTPYSTQTHPQTAAISTTSSQYSWQSNAVQQQQQQQKSPATNTANTTNAKTLSDKANVDNKRNLSVALDKDNGDDNKVEIVVESSAKMENQLDPNDDNKVADNRNDDKEVLLKPEQSKQQQQQQQAVIQPMFKALSRSKSGSGGHSPVSNSSFITSAPRLNYEDEGLSAADVQEVLSQLEIRPDTLRDSSTDFRPVFSCIRPIVCHKSNTPFYAQCSTAKLGYCTWCRQLRRGNQKQGSICLNCGERLTAKYHRWYPHLVRLEPLEKTRTKAMYIKYKPVFERFGITWHNDKQFDFVIDHYMLMKIYLSTENFNIDPLHLERTYMIGVFAGREFNTGALARKLLREGSKLAMFRADFPDYYDFLRDERAAVAEQMNLRFFQGVYKCYFHAHYTNIEGWYDPSVISRESIIETFKELCNTILAHTALAHINQNGGNANNGNNDVKTTKSITISNNGRGANGARKYTKKSNQHKRNDNKHDLHHQKRGNSHRGVMNNNMNNNGNNNGNNNNNMGNMNNMNNMNMMNMNVNNIEMRRRHQQQQRRHHHAPQQNIITLTNPNGQIQQTPMMNMVPQGMPNMMHQISPNTGIPNVFQPNPLGLTPNGMNHQHLLNQMQLNGGNVPPLNLLSSTNNPHQAGQVNAELQQQQQQQQQQPQIGDKNQLLAATQSMLNGISAMPPLNQLSVTNMAAITPIAKVKTFQFSNPTASTPQAMIRTNSQTQISPAYLPPLATTPRFTVPTPRGTPSAAQTYTAINLSNMNSISNNVSMNASPLQLQQQNGSNPSSVSMLAANGNLQIPSSMLKNTNTGNKGINNNNNSNKKDERKSDGNNKNDGKSSKNSKDNKSGDNKKQNKSDGAGTSSGSKNSLNAGAAPFLLHANGVISPPISPRNFNRNHNRFVPPPPPQSFAFPAPPLPQTTNWLPVPPVLSATTPTNAQNNAPMMNPNINGMNNVNNLQMNVNNINAINNQLNNKDMMNANNGLNQNQINVALVHNRGSPLFTPTQSPQFRPFSH